MFLAKKITQLILKTFFLVQSDRVWPPSQSQSLNCTQIRYEEEKIIACPTNFYYPWIMAK